MAEAYWKDEPDRDQLSRFYSLLTSDPGKAVAGLEALAQRGSTMSMWYLADAYVSGTGLPKDSDRAKYWYAKADQMGCAPASYMLGRMCIKAQEYDVAFAAFSRGAQKGYLPCMYRLAKMFQDGVGTRRDLHECRRLLEAAVSKGHIFSKRDLATLYVRGSFGLIPAMRGLFLFASLVIDVAGLVVRAIKPGSTIDERVLA
jgi:TPR repeat protein